MIDVGNVFYDFRRRLVNVGSALQWSVRAISGILFGHRGEVSGNHQVRAPDGHEASVIQPHRAITQRLHVSGGVRYEENRDSAGAQLVDFTYAALAEVDIAYSERLV